MTAPHMPMVDVSANNHGTGQSIDWAKVRAAGYLAVMVKATEGVDYVNPWLKEDAEGAANAGLLVGYYHFARPSQASAAAQASVALNAIRRLPRNLGLALDLEVAEGLSWDVLASQANIFHEDVLRQVEHSPLYCNDYFLQNLPGAPWGERLWLAQTARPRREVWAWQQTTPQVVDGIPGVTDVNVIHPG